MPLGVVRAGFDPPLSVSPSENPEELGEGEEGDAGGSPAKLFRETSWPENEDELPNRVTAPEPGGPGRGNGVPDVGIRDVLRLGGTLDGVVCCPIG